MRQAFLMDETVDANEFDDLVADPSEIDEYADPMEIAARHEEQLRCSLAQVQRLLRTAKLYWPALSNKEILSRLERALIDETPTELSERLRHALAS